MENSKFNIKINPNSGAINSISVAYDPHKMNWCIENREWGTIRCLNYDGIWGNYMERAKEMKLVSFKEDEVSSESVYSNDEIQVCVNRCFNDDGDFIERYTIKNLTDVDIFIRPGEFGIVVPFSDVYTNSEECMTNRCNTHIWCANNSSYVNALKMGASDINLGLVLTKGNLHSYSTIKNRLNGHATRGDFIFNTVADICAGEEYVIEWLVFVHEGKEDFINRACETPSFVYIDAKQNTVYEGENLEFTAVFPNDTKKVEVYSGNEKIECVYDEISRKISVSYKPKTTGETRIKIAYDDKETYADFIVVKPLEEIVKTRIDFILNNQQYIKCDSPLHGAYLIYDNKENYKIFENSISDHNASRERIGMALLIARYLRSNSDEKIRKSLDLYIEFLKREFYEEKTGEVFDTVRKNSEFVRLYNLPWVMMLFAEMYFLTKDKYYIENISRMADNYYSNGGFKFYPNAVSPALILSAFEESGTDATKIKSYFINHAENILNTGLAYPPHEVNYEQTIVSPAVTILSEMAKVTGDNDFKNAAKLHAEVLERFNGSQPSFHLNEIPIRYWDAFWFGKCRLAGDTFPHYWSCLTAHSYADYYLISGDEKYRIAAEKCIRNCMCLFTDDGKGSSAYMYPFKVDDVFCEFYDDWANDQDFALYYALLLDEMDIYKVKE